MFTFQYVKDLTKRLQKPDKNKRRRAPAQEEMRDEDGESIELDIDLHCQDLTIRELEFIMVGILMLITYNRCVATFMVECLSN